MDTLLSVKDVAAILRLNPRTVAVWLRSGKLPGLKVESEWRVSQAELQDWLAARRVAKTVKAAP